MMRTRQLLLFAVLVFTATLLPAQEPAQEPVQVPPTLYLYTAGPGSGTANERLLAELVFLRLSTALAVRVVEGELGEAIPEADDEKTLLAGEAGADAWLELRAGPEGGGLSVAVRLYVLAEERFAADQKLSVAGSVDELEKDFWDQLLDVVSGTLPQHQQRVVVNTRIVETREVRVIPYEVGTRVTVHARPGTRISGLKPYPLFVAADGTVSTEVAPNATYSRQADHWRYLPLTERIYVDKTARAVKLEQEKGSRFALEGLTHFEESLGIGVRYFPLPGSLFAGLRIISSFQSLSPPYDFKNDDDRWFSRNLYVGFNAGSFLNRKSRRLRFGLAAGGFVRFYSRRNDPGLELHPVFPYGLTLGPVFDLAAGERFGLVFEWMPEFYIYIPFDESLTGPDAPYEGMDPYPWEDLTSGRGDIRVNTGSTFLGVRYSF